MVAIFNYLATGGASILFFMISGALILNKERDTLPFFKKRITRVVFPMIFWSLIFIIWGYLKGKYSFSDVLSRVIMIPFSPQVGVYWFIYVIFGIYLITPILSLWLNKCTKRDIELYLAIWTCTLLLPYLNLIDERFQNSISFIGGSLYYFYGFVGFAILGHYLRRYVSIDIKDLSFLLFVIGVVVLPICLYALPVPHNVIHNRMSINIALLSICYFVFLKHLRYSQKWSERFYNFAQHTFGIYLVHFYLMRDLIWKLFEPYNIHYAIQVPLIVLITVVSSYCVVHLISKLPYSKYIVGL